MLALLAIIIFGGKTEEDDGMSVANWGDTTEEVASTVEERKVVYTKSEFKGDGKTSYWFVKVQKKNSGTQMNAFIYQEHSYFDPKAALRHFGEEKDFFLDDFKEVSEATFYAANKKN